MEDEASTSLDGKVLGNLRVVDLKQELEKRGLSKSGSKKDLVKRLKQQLEFEKLCEERKSSGDHDRKLELDAAIEQNEFVQQYLAQQQKRYAERKEEEKRLEMEALQRQTGGEEDDSNENQVTAAKDSASDSDEAVDEKSNDSCEPSRNVVQSENKDEANIRVIKALSADGGHSNTSETEDEESNCPSSLAVSGNVNIEISSPEPKDPEGAENNQNNAQSLVDATEKEKIVKSKSPQSSPAREEEKFETLKVSENDSEIGGNEHGDVSAPSVSDSVKEQTDCVTRENINDSDDNKLEIFNRDLNDVVDNEETTTSAAHSSDITEQTECVAPQTNVLNTSEKNEKNVSSCHASLGGDSSPENLCKQDSMADMESECSSVPYSLSDIQLPESPGHHLKSKDLNGEESANKTEIVSAVTVDQNLMSDPKIQSNGVSTVDTLNSSNEEVVSESETKESANSIDSPEKPCQRKELEDNRQTDESSDVESDKNDNQYKKKSFKYEDTSSNIAVDSEEENAPRDIPKKGQKSLKHPHQSDESDNDKSSDSDKYKRSRLDSKHKSHDKHRKRNRRSRSRSSSSSSSRSSDSSPRRRHSKKSVVTIKSKNFVENDESNQMSDKSSDEKPDKQKNEDSSIESPSVPSVSTKRRLKIKRDNVAVELSSANVESVESTSSKSIDNIPSSNSHSVSEKPSKQESTEIKLSFSDLPYAPRKVSLSNRKLNRKSSEDKSNNEPKSKRSKWESFAAGQKVSQTISISTDSLKNWFPDFKLISEPSSMEIEPDEHSLPAADEKTTSLGYADVSNGNEIGMRRDSTSQMEVEDSESQEPNFEDSAHQGPVSKIIFIQNLVRPFTLNQLKDLLKLNGKIVEEYFWIDKIKSKCFVMYETEKEAIKARNALNNTRWPSSNPKILSVEFTNEEELEQHKKGNEPPPKPVIEPPVLEAPEVIEARVSHPVEEHKRKDRERRKERERSKPQPPVREWDKDKVMQESPEREHIPKEEKSRSSDKKEKKESKKRPNEDTPAKLLDDLFQKTKNPPCIYWLPLTEEQAKQKEEAKKMRKLEREKRNQQLKEQEEAERRNKRARSSRRSREKENRKSSTRSRSPVTRRR